MKKRIRIGMGIASVLLLAAEIWLALSCSTSMALLLSNLVVPALLYTILRCISPADPNYGTTLPCLLFIALSGAEAIVYAVYGAVTSADFRYLSGIYMLVLLACFFSLVPCCCCELILRRIVNLPRIAAAVTGMFAMLLVFSIDEFIFSRREPEIHPLSYPCSIIGMVVSAVMVLTAAGVVLYYIINTPFGARLRKVFSSAAASLICAGLSLPIWGAICYWFAPYVLNAIF